jgi:hypothetical protein
MLSWEQVQHQVCDPGMEDDGACEEACEVSNGCRHALRREDVLTKGTAVCQSRDVAHTKSADNSEDYRYSIRTEDLFTASLI